MNKDRKSSCAGCPYVYSTDAPSCVAGSKFALESFCLHPSLKDNRACSLGFSTESTYCDTPDWCPLLGKQVEENNEDVVDIIPAKKANQIAEDANKKCLRDQLLLINDGILKAANEGCYEFCCDLCVDREVKHILEEAGYTVETRDYDNFGVQLLTKITWSRLLT